MYGNLPGKFTRANFDQIYGGQGGGGGRGINQKGELKTKTL